MKRKLIMITAILILAGIYLAQYTKTFNFSIVDTKTGKVSLGVLNVKAILTWEHDGYVDVDGRKYIGRCAIEHTENYDYKGNCRFEYEKSYIACNINTSVASSEHNISGVCSDESGSEYKFARQ